MDKMNHSSAEAETETIEPLRYLSKGEAAAIETELLKDYRFGQQQLIEIWGQACALAITKAYPLSSISKKQPTVLVICGPDQNGSIGLVCARHLRIFCEVGNSRAEERAIRKTNDGHLFCCCSCFTCDL